MMICDLKKLRVKNSRSSTYAPKNSQVLLFQKVI